MNVVYMIIIISIIITVFMIIMFLYNIYNTIFETPLTNNEGLTIDNTVKQPLLQSLNAIKGGLRSIYIKILLFYLIFYILYLIIITIIPPTGPATIFIPIRELLLKIPPFEDLINFGVFRLLDKLFSVFGIDGWINKIITANNALITFSSENIRVILYYLLPNYKNDIDEYIDKVQKEEKEGTQEGTREEKEREKEETKEETKEEKEEKEIKKDTKMKIEEEVEVCVANRLKLITPDMTATERVKNIYDNSMAKVYCQSRSIGKYIRSNI